MFADDLRNEFFTTPGHMTSDLKFVLTENGECNLRATREQFDGLLAMHQLATKAARPHLREPQIGIATSAHRLVLGTSESAATAVSHKNI
jgi:hypothetical protein